MILYSLALISRTSHYCTQIVGYTFLLVQFLGPSVFAGIAAMFVVLPLNSYFLRRCVRAPTFVLFSITVDEIFSTHAT